MHISFLAAIQKETRSCKTQGDIHCLFLSVCPFVCPPTSLAELKSALPGLKCPLKHEICPLKTWNLASQAWNLLSEAWNLSCQIWNLSFQAPSGFKSALSGLKFGQKDKRKSTCVLQDFVPFGAAAQKSKGHHWSEGQVERNVARICASGPEFGPQD